MTVYTLSSTQTEDSFVDWNDTSLWSQGKAPNDAGAQVYFNDTGLNYFVEIGQSESISIGSFSLQANHLLLGGALVSAGSLTVAADAGIQIQGGTLIAQSLHFDGTSTGDLGLVGVGTVTVAGPIYNDSTIIGGNVSGLSSLTTLTLNAAYFDNVGVLEAAVGATVTVDVAQASGFANYVYGTLVGGTYVAQSDATLDLKTNGLITSDSATLILDGAGTDLIASYNPSSGHYDPIQSSLTLITAKGTLELDAASYATAGILTVQGMLNMVGVSSFSAGTLYLTSGGEAFLSDILPSETMKLASGQIINDGLILVDGSGGGTATIAGTILGSGSITLGPAVTTIDRYGNPVTTTASVELTGKVANALTFSDGTGSFLLDTPTAVTGSVQHFTAGDSIVLPTVALSAVTSYSYTGSATSGVLTLHEGASTINLAFAGHYATQDFSLEAGPSSAGLTIVGVAGISSV